MAKRKTIGEHALDVLRDTDNPAIMWGDCGLLDMVARRAGMREGLHPLTRWQRVLAGIERSGLFEKSFSRLKPGMQGNQVCRVFYPLATPAAAEVLP